jgi:hypothetical protein
MDSILQTVDVNLQPSGILARGIQNMNSTSSAKRVSALGIVSGVFGNYIIRFQAILSLGNSKVGGLDLRVSVLNFSRSILSRKTSWSEHLRVKKKNREEENRAHVYSIRMEISRKRQSKNE